MRHVDLLQGFQMVAALTQDTVNYQFSQLHKQQVIHPQLNLVMEDTGIELHAILSAPTVSFSVPDAHRTVLFLLNMPSGTFTYWDGFGSSAKKNTVEFKDWTYAFRVNLDMQHIAQDAIKAGTAVPQVVKDHLEQFNDSLFSIKHLFLDFENADLASFDPNHTRMRFPDDAHLSPGQLTQFQQAISNYFNSLKGTNNPYILGYSIENSSNPDLTVNANATFNPTASTFSTFDDPTNEGMNALNFLLVTGGAQLPTDPNAGIYPSNWVKSREYDGKFVISSGLFWNEWLLKNIKNGLMVGDPNPTDNGWVFDHSNNDNYTVKDGVKCISSLTKVDAHNNITDHRTANVTYKNVDTASVEVDLSGIISKTYRCDFTCIFSEWMSETATIDWNGKLTISAGTDGLLQPNVEMNVPKASKSTDGNWLGKGDIALIPDNQKALDSVGSQFDTYMQNTLHHFQNCLSDLGARFVLPAGEVFYFKNPQMDDAGNLLLDISYKSDH